MKNVLKILLFNLLLLLLSCHSGNNTPSVASRLANIDLELLINEQIENCSIPAIAIGIIDPESMITHSYGVKGLHDQLPVETHDKYNIGSCTKAFTSFLAARLIKKGSIKYETTVNEILGSADDIHPYYLDKTLGDLLSHRAGIRPFIHENEFKSIPCECLDKSIDNRRQLFSEWVLTREPIIDPQQSYIYSNAGYTVAATMLEKAGNKSWETLMSDEVFKPLGIEGWYGFPHLYADNQPRGHINLRDYDKNAEDKLIQFPDSSKFGIYLIEPGGGISLTITEHAIFLQELLRGLNGNGHLLSRSDYSDLLNSKQTYINGWLQLKTDNIFYLAHEGSNGMFYACAILCKQLNYGIVILSNSGSEESKQGIQNIIYAIDNELRKHR